MPTTMNFIGTGAYSPWLNGLQSPYGNYPNWCLAKGIATSAIYNGVGNSLNTITGPITAGLYFDEGGTGLLHFISAPVTSEVTISGTVSFALSGSQNSMNANTTFAVRVERLGYDGTVTTIMTSVYSGELSTSNTYHSWTGTPTTTVMRRGDRFRFVPYVTDGGGTMAAGYIVYFYYGGDGSGLGSYVQFTETISLGEESPATSGTLYLTTNASDITTADTDLELALTAKTGGATVTATTDTGPRYYYGPIQFQYSGAPVTWWSPPLYSVSVDYVALRLTGTESNALANATIYAKLSITEQNGSNPVLFAAGVLEDNGTTTELGTTGLTRDLKLQAPPVTLVDGQRLMLRLYLTDSSPGLMAAGYTASITVDADTFANLKTVSALSEYVTPTDTKLYLQYGHGIGARSYTYFPAAFGGGYVDVSGNQHTYRGKGASRFPNDQAGELVGQGTGETPPVNIRESIASTAWVYFVTDPLKESVLLSGTVSFSMDAYEENTKANGGVGVKIYRVNNEGNMTLILNSLSTELGTTGPKTWTATPSSTQLYAGDRLLFIPYFDQVGTFGLTYTLYLRYGGLNTYVNFADVMTFANTSGGGTKLVLRDTASDLATADVDLALTLDTFGSVNTDITGTTGVGWTTPERVTSGSVPVTWWSPTLSAATLSGVIKVFVRTPNTNAFNVCCEVAVANSNGSILSVYGRGWSVNSPAIMAYFEVYVAGPPTSIPQGGRLVFRLYWDDLDDYALNNTSAAVRYNGAQGSGDSYVELPITVTTGDPPAGSPKADTLLPPTRRHLHILTR